MVVRARLWGPGAGDVFGRAGSPRPPMFSRTAVGRCQVCERRGRRRRGVVPRARGPGHWPPRR
eukprot:5940124-Lingulodinium_polyedra.AAC.1